MTKVFLVRHAEAEGNLYRRIHGWYDSRITENGFRQIEALKDRFKDIHIDAIYSSDKIRTKTTAGAIYVPKGLELHTDPGLREINMGRWEDIPWGETAHFEPDALVRFNLTALDWKVDGSETFEEFGERVSKAILRIAEKHPDQTICCVSHGSAIRQALGVFSNTPKEAWSEMPHGDNTAVSLIEVDNGEVRIVFRDDNSHLSEEISTLAHQGWWKKLRKPEDANLWFEDFDVKNEQDLYRQCRAEAWKSSHGTMDGYEPEHFLKDAMEHAAFDPHAVRKVMMKDEMAGIIQLNFPRQEEEHVGWIPFYYVAPKYRKQGLGIQLLGEAVSQYRQLGRNALRLRCARDNAVARRFYEKHGFYKIDELNLDGVILDIMEKKI